MARQRSVKDADLNGNLGDEWKADDELSAPKTNDVTKSSSTTTTTMSRCDSGQWRTWEFVDYHTLPSFLHDNEYLISGHRPELRSTVECLKSAFMLHTETWNIWTHFLGAAGSLALCIYFVLYVAQDWEHQLAFAVFFLGAVFCMGVSATYHAFICHSENICKFLAKMDYVGIIVLIVTSYVPWLHFAFYCNSYVKLLYFALIFSVGALCISVVVKDEFREPSYRWIRFGLFVCLGGGGIIPGVHSVVFHDLLDIHGFPLWLVCMAVLYLIGGFAYAVRIPERLCPGKFDIWLQSHQIMHVCVIGGVLTCYLGAAKLAMERLDLGTDCLSIYV